MDGVKKVELEINKLNRKIQKVNTLKAIIKRLEEQKIINIGKVLEQIKNALDREFKALNEEIDRMEKELEFYWILKKNKILYY